MKLTAALIISMGILACQASLAATIYVDQANGDDMNNGQTPGTAVATITQGSQLVNDGDTLDIAAGTYGASSGENYPIFFSQSINLEGAGPDLTVLDGELNSQILQFSSIDSIINIDGLAVVNGSSNLGAGIRVNAASELNLSNCRFEGNEGSIGGALLVQNAIEASVIDCHFEGNNAAIGGAAQVEYNDIFDVNLDGVMNVTHSTFINNGRSQGSAIHFQGNVEATYTLNIDQSHFLNNSGSHTLRYQEGTEATVLGQVTNSIFSGNTNLAISSPKTPLNIVNVTFVNNEDGFSSFPDDEPSNIVNSIFWNNDDELRGEGSTVSYSIIKGLDIDDHIDGGNNIDLDPLLNADYRLTGSSPAIDMGNDQAIDDLGLSQDIDLQPRKVDLLGLNRPEGVVDMGANELTDLIFADGFEL